MTNNSILLIDDEDISRKVIAHALEQAGHQVTSCASGAIALDCLNKNTVSFDLIILDQIMPEMNGFAFLEELKKLPKQASIPVIMLTAVDDGQLMVQAVEYGVLDYLTKPVDPQHLLAVVNQILA